MLISFCKINKGHHHKLVKHNGLRETLNSTRPEYRVPHCRNTIRKFIFSCITSKKNEGKPCSYHQHSNLPKENFSEDHAFLHVGIDCTIPLHVRNIYSNHSNDMYKPWVVNITCVSSRRFYLDLVPDCTSKSCISILRRFISKEGLHK